MSFSLHSISVRLQCISVAIFRKNRDAPVISPHETVNYAKAKCLTHLVVPELGFPLAVMTSTLWLSTELSLSCASKGSKYGFTIVWGFMGFKNYKFQVDHLSFPSYDRVQCDSGQRLVTLTRQQKLSVTVWCNELHHWEREEGNLWKIKDLVPPSSSEVCK